MVSAPKIVTAYCAVIFSALLLLLFWPANTDRLLVIVSANIKSDVPLLGLGGDQRLYAALDGIDARVVEQVNNHSFIIAIASEKSGEIASQLMSNGAVLVVNAKGDFGCSGSLERPSFRRTGA
jgi:hypothetical protein